MAGLLYFLPLVARVDRDLLHQTLGHVLEPDDQPAQGEIGAGPDGGRGVLIALDPEPDCGLGYDPAAQTWCQAAGGTLWLGYPNDARPSPQDLLREEVVAGHLVRLGDGQEWMVPTARYFAGGSTLPQSIVLGPNGEKVTRALPRFAALSRHADRCAQNIRILMGMDERPKDWQAMSVDEGWDICVDALALNYRLGPNEVSLLELVTTQNMQHILEALCDWQTVQAVAEANIAAQSKKNAADIPDGGGTDD